MNCSIFTAMNEHFMKTCLRTLLLLSLAAATLTATRAADAKETFEKQCASCHGKDGKGQTKMGRQVDVKDYTDPKVQDAFKDDEALTKVKEGINEKGKDRMKPFKDKLTDDELKGLIAYMRTFKGAK